MADLDSARFAALLRRLGATADPALLFETLRQAWSEPHRAYHNTRHLAGCLTLLNATRALSSHPDEIEAALWFHDAVYDPHRADNETRSADWAAQALGRAGVGADVVGRVGMLVLVTGHDAEPADGDQRLIADIDLAILGASDAEFDRYDRAIRSEYAWVPAEDYRRERGAVLRGLLARKPLYRTAALRDREAAARANIERALGWLER